MLNKTKGYMIVRITIFFFIILFPLILTLINSENKVIGNEEKIEKPILFKDGSINKEYNKEFDKYFTSSFKMRNELIKLNAIFQYKAFGITLDKAIKGKDDWLFLLDTRNNYTGEKMYTNEILEEMKRNLIGKQKYLKDKGIEFLIVIPPNKNSLYPEYMPDDIKKVRENTIIDDFYDYMKINTNLNLVDLRTALEKGKKDTNLYLKRDTHWNHYGAYIAYNEIINKISNDMPNIHVSKKQFDIGSKGGKDTSLDLAKMLLINGYTKDSFTYVKDYKPSYSEIEREEHDGIIKTLNINKNLSKAVVFRDSFSELLVPFLSESFGEVNYYWGGRIGLQDPYFDKNFIEKDKPNVVIVEIVERLLDNLNITFR